jgi:chromatin assembly factor 1 subunit A
MSLDPVDFDPPTPTKSKHVISDSNKQAKQHNSQDKGFLPFVLGKNARLAPINAFLPAEDELVRVNASMDGFIGRKQQEPSPSVQECFVRERVQRGFQPPRVAKVVQKLQGSSNAPIDLTQDSRNKPMDELRAIPLKYFFYGEDVRPPYKGTWTRPVDSRTARKLALKPLAQVLPEVVYDYDSEAEWDDAEEGEDIDIEDGDDEEDVEDEETEDFIDDDNAPQYLARRGLPANDVEPICSGLQWQDANGKLKSADPRYADADFKEFEVCFLLDPSPSTIDPFTTAYWEPEPKKAPVTPLTSSMGPPRLPLSDRTNGQGTIQATLVNGKVPKAAKVGPRLVPADVLPAFRAAVDGSDMTKIALIEALKKQYVQF